MLDILNAWVTSLANFWEHYTDVGCIIAGAVCGWCVAAIVETYFVPTYWPVHKQKGVTILVTICVSWFAAAMLWWVTDPIDPLRMRITVTGVLSPISPFGYVWVGRILTKKFPSIGSVWSLEKP
jgi:hypothetical protein